MLDKLLTYQQVADELALPSAHTVKTLRKAGKIPAVKLGYRTFRFRLPAVEAALGRLEKKAIK